MSMDNLVKRLRNGDHFEKVVSAEQAADRIEELEAKLAKAVETISLCRKMQAQFAHTEDPLMVLLDTTIAELSSVSCANLKGQNDER
jgi:ribosome-interacting GTPase 1